MVSIVGPSLWSSPGTSPTTSHSSMPRRVQRHHRSDQPTPLMSLPSTSLSTRLPPIKHQAAAASPLLAAASPPLFHATGFQCALLDVDVASSLSHWTDSRPIVLPPPLGSEGPCMRPSSPSLQSDIPGSHRATSYGARRHRPRIVFVSPSGCSSPTLSTVVALLHVTCMTTYRPHMSHRPHLHQSRYRT